MRYILAVSDNNCIALNGTLPWHIRHDFLWFKMNTYNCPVIMGRKTWDSLPKKPLPGRRNMVLSSNKHLGVETFQTVEELNRFVEKHPSSWIIGGATLCNQLWKNNDVLILTRVHMNVKNGLVISLPKMKCVWEKTFDGYTFSINLILL
jgi:dihydrofolate reductase